MTCVVAVKQGDVVYMGSDSALSDPDTSALRTLVEPKVFKRGSVMIGGAMSVRILQLLRHSFVPPKRPISRDIDAYVATSFVDELRRCLEEGGALQREGNVDLLDACLLASMGGEIFCIETDFQSYRTPDLWASIGSGSEIAMGSLHSTAHTRASPEKRIRMALSAAEAYNVHVRGPFHVINSSHEKATRKQA